MGSNHVLSRSVGERTWTDLCHSFSSDWRRVVCSGSGSSEVDDVDEEV